MKRTTARAIKTGVHFVYVTSLWVFMLVGLVAKDLWVFLPAAVLLILERLDER